ncbi:unnamed protein product [Callosobruchus maculatus]|uniref:Uncharacterized protein n=1 Tax=Callosobruchus maculatus TaxID=64391 RepID=A0A653BKX9_CALMS|nr:unnamed protein product [Callosobruchus maculatus]
MFLSEANIFLPGQRLVLPLFASDTDVNVNLVLPYRLNLKIITSFRTRYPLSAVQSDGDLSEIN